MLSLQPPLGGVIPLTNLALVHAIRMLSGADRTPEESWLALTFDKWRRVADLAAQYSDDGDLDLGDEQMP
ncbi:hypothetical protein [Methylocystis parvus]|uniref:Uncharacterized protein n=1 Tax=Methylocystis parvus TaxID=134 RepID=A0A6B8MGV2_9HYPH|nr:hypothetical protein [Methylocystis parvus]QGM99900.1 hypothetical protein F7D14_20080 [Methylocystis parvus]WBK02324.1 hypothetical protein MMG94_19930 [Methylocystis parvus OBBP]